MTGNPFASRGQRNVYFVTGPRSFVPFTMTWIHQGCLRLLQRGEVSQPLYLHALKTIGVSFSGPKVAVGIISPGGQSADNRWPIPICVTKYHDAYFAKKLS